MRIGYKTTAHGDVSEHTALTGRVEECCPGMAEAWASEAVVFGEGTYTNVGAPPKAQIAYTESDYDCGVHRTYYPIDFCPFCGKRVECVEEQRTKVVEEYEDVQVTQRRLVRREVPA